MVTSICPHCGFDVQRAERSLKVGRLSIVNGVTAIDDQPITLTPQGREILEALLRCHPGPATSEALIGRLGFEESDDPAKALNSRVSLLRTALRRHGLPRQTITPIYKLGYQLVA